MVTVVRTSNVTKNTICASGAASRPPLGQSETFHIISTSQGFSTASLCTWLSRLRHKLCITTQAYRMKRNDKEDLNKIKNNGNIRFEHLLQHHLLYQPKNRRPSFCKTCPQQMGTAENWQTHYQDRYGSSSRLVTIFRTVFIISTRALNFT